MNPTPTARPNRGHTTSGQRGSHGVDDPREHGPIEGRVGRADLNGDPLGQLVEVGLASAAGQAPLAEGLALGISPVDAPPVAAAGAGRRVAPGVAGAAHPAVAPGHVRRLAAVAFDAGGVPPREPAWRRLRRVHG